MKNTFLLVLILFACLGANAGPCSLSLGVIKSDVSCYGGSNGTITVTPIGGTAPFHYQWNIVDTTANVTGLAPGTYSVTVTDAVTCSASTSISITQPAQIVLTDSVRGVTCNGAANGTAGVTVSGGTGPFVYSWTGGGISSTITGLSGGTYYLTVNDFNGCKAYDTLVVPEPAVLNNSGTITNVSCHGGTNGAINVVVTGGTSPFTYHWNDTSTVAHRTSLTAATYQLTVTDAHGCTSTGIYRVFEPLTLVIDSVISKNVTCHGAADGYINVYVSGGNFPYTFNWSNGATTQNLSGLNPGSFHIQVTDSLGCITGANASITQPNSLVLTGSITNTSSAGAHNGAITTIVTGGIPPYVYQWSDTATTQNRSGIDTGTYTLVVVDNNGCVVSKTFTVAVSGAGLSATAAVTNVNCYGALTGSITVTASGGVPTYQYRINGGNYQNSNVFTNLAAGSYFVTFKDGTNGTYTFSATVTQPAPINIAGTTTSETTAGAQNGAISITVSGGTPGYHYAWADGPGSQNRNSISAGTYTLTVSDANSCTASKSFTVLVGGGGLNATASTTNVTCNGGSNGTITVTAAGGTQPYQYKLAGGNYQLSNVFNNLGAGSYMVTVKDATSLTYSFTLSITQGTAITISGAVTNISSLGVPDGSIAIAASGGATPYTYLWSDAVTTQNRSMLDTGVYNITVTDVNNCTAAKSYIVGVAGVPLTATAVGTDLVCYNGGTGTITVSAHGGTSPFSYSIGASNFQSSNLFTGLNGGIYTITVKDANSSTFNLNITLLQPGIILDTLTPAAAICHGDSSGNITISVSGGTPGYNYHWSNGATTGNLTGVPAGTYTLTITDNAACTVTASATITQPVAITINGNVSDASNTVSSNGAIAVGASGGVPGYTYLWNDNATNSSRIGLLYGTYIVTVTDAHNCTASASFYVSCPLVASTSAIDVSCYGQHNGIVIVNPIGGRTPYQYKQGSGNYQTSSTFTNLAPGTYTFTVKDSLGATFNVNASITQPTALRINGTVVNTSTSGANDGTITTVASGGTQPYGFMWNTSSIQQNLTGLGAGTYVVTVTDGNNCTVSKVFNVGIGIYSNILNLYMDTVTGITGQQVIIPIMVKNFVGIESIQGSITWDSSKISLVHAEQFNLGTMSASNVASYGNKLTYSWTDGTFVGVTKTNGSTIFALRFNVIGGQGDTSVINFDTLPVAQQYIDTSFTVIASHLLPGLVKIITTATVSGRILSTAGDPIHSVTVTATGPITQTFYTDTSGSYTFTYAASSSTVITPTKTNDSLVFNGVSIADMVYVQRHVLNRQHITGAYKILAADVNISGSINNSDLVLIRGLVLGNNRSFNGKLWSFVPAGYTFPNPNSPYPTPFNISLTNMVQDYPGQDFVGIKLGDINDTWNPNIKSLGDSVYFNVGSGTVLKNDTIAVPVTTRNFNFVSGFQFSMQWDSSIMSYLRVDTGKVKVDYSTNFTSGGVLTFTWLDPNGLYTSIPDDSTLFYVYFKGKGYNGQTTAAIINSAYTPIEVVDSSIKDLPVATGAGYVTILSSISELESNIKVTVVPNPFAGGADLRFATEKAGEVALEIMDISGQRVEKQVYQMQSGEQKLHFGEHLAAGMYFINISTPDGHGSLKVVSVAR